MLCIKMPRLFSNGEYADIHFIYGFCDGNAQQAVQEYRRRYPNRRRPNIQVFIDTHRNFCERDCEITDKTEMKIEEILEEMITEEFFELLTKIQV